MKVEDIMTKNVVSVTPETKITEVANILFKNRFHGVPVVDSDNKVAGIVTEGDFFARDSSNTFLPSYINFLKESKVNNDISKDKKEKIDKLLNAQVKEIMNVNCTTILKDMGLHDLMEFFKTTRYNTLPVVDQSDKLIGIVTLADVISLIKA
jgi:CBS domain-containing protein